MKKSSHYFIFSIILLIAIGGYFIFNEDDVKISDIEWHCNWEGTKGNCFITYKIENTTNDVLFPVIYIRAQHVRQGKYGSVEVVGEKIKRIELSPTGSLIMQEELPVDKHPTIILVVVR